MKTLNDDIKVLGRPLLFFVGIFVLFLISVKIIFDNVSNLNAQADANQKTESSLQSKLVSLQNTNPQVSQDSQYAVTALPASNPVFVTLSQIRGFAQSLSINLSNIVSSQISNKEPFSNNLSFDAEGAYSDLQTFIGKIKGSAPISLFTAIKITSEGGKSAYKLTTSISSYWSSLPTTLPTIDEPIQMLSSDEQALLKQISSLQQPALSQASVTTSNSPSVPSGKTDPFSK